MKKILIILYFASCLLLKVQAQTTEECSLTVNNIKWGALTTYCNEETAPYLSFWWDKNTDKVELQYGSIDFKLGEGITHKTDDYYIIDIPQADLESNKEYSYYVRACCDGNCGEWSERKYFDTKPTSGIHLELNEQVFIYPNPTKGQFNIELNDLFKNKPYLKVALTGMDGKVIQNMREQDVYDISQLPSGLYIITISNSENSISRTIQKQ